MKNFRCQKEETLCEFFLETNGIERTDTILMSTLKSERFKNIKAELKIKLNKQTNT